MGALICCSDSAMRPRTTESSMKVKQSAGPMTSIHDTRFEVAKSAGLSTMY